MSTENHPLIATLFAEDYQVESLLAEGGMGAVFSVLQRSTGRRRALKVLHPSLVADPATRARFVREARVPSTIESDHVVEVIDAGFDPATRAPFLVMELLDGQDLHRYVATHGALAVREAREVLRQLCHALSAAHAAGVIHRDLKPENVFVARTRRADVPFTIKLLDFGIASVLESAATSHATGAIVGSPAWMAPEQVDTGLIRASTDVWALGLIAFWTLTGRHYWKSANTTGATLQALLVEKLVEPLERASERAKWLGLPTALSPSFDDWFSRCVCRDPQARFRDGVEAWTALSAVLDAPMSSASLAADATIVAAPSAPSLSAPVALLAQQSQPVARTVLSSPTAPAVRSRGSKKTAAVIASVVSLLGGASSAAWYVRSRNTVLPIAQQPSSRAQAAPAVIAPQGWAGATRATGDAAAASDPVHAVERPAPRRAEPSSRAAPVPRRPVEQRASRTLPTVSAPVVSQPAQQQPVATPSGPRPSRCSTYIVLENRANALLVHAASVEATEPATARNERIQAMAMRASVDSQVAQLRTMARGELASDPEFVAMAREADQCVANLRRAHP